LSAVRLYYQSTLLHQLTAGQPPTVTLTSEAPATLPNRYSLTWESSPADLVYLVRFSPDNGATWMTLTPPIAGNRYDIDVTTLPGTTTGLLEVVASSGLNSTRVHTPLFNVPYKEPQVAILGVSDRQRFVVNETVTLMGDGYDFEDGILPKERFSWSSDLDGYLGPGATLAVQDLSIGLHTFTLQATDNDGQTGETQIEIEIYDPAWELDQHIYLPLVFK
jgi:hypothetical protein